MTTSDARKRIQDHINAMHARFDIAMTGAWPYPPTEPTPKEHDMARPKISHRDEADHWYHVKLTPEVAEREKRHEKVVANALLAIHDDVRRIADALTRDHLHRLLAEESAAERRDEPGDVTEEPPVGSQVTDREGDVWQRFDETNHRGWTVWDDRDRCWGLAAAVDCLWFQVRNHGPLRLTTDADRERVGLPVECRGEDCEGCGAGADPDESRVIRDDHGGIITRTAPDVDPDEALARAMYEHDDDDEPGTWPPPHPDDLAYWMRLARVALEHIEAEWEEVARSFEDGRDKWQAEARRQRARAEKAEADVERLTREAKMHENAANDLRGHRDRHKAETRAAVRRARVAEGRHEALRGDVDRERINAPTVAGAAPLTRILDRDDERGRDAER